MATLQRSLVNLEMLSDDISTLAHSELNSAVHIRLLYAFLTVLNELNKLVEQETEASFHNALLGTLFEDIFLRKRMVSVYVKLTGYVITAWEAASKANSIITDNFDEGADKRLELLQVKAIRAKSQLKTVVSAMGIEDYNKFTEVLGLTSHEWQWDTLRARF